LNLVSKNIAIPRSEGAYKIKTRYSCMGFLLSPNDAVIFRAMNDITTWCYGY